MKNRFYSSWFVFKYGTLLKLTGWLFMIPVLLIFLTIAKVILAILFNQYALCMDAFARDYEILQTWQGPDGWLIKPLEPNARIIIGPLHQELTVPGATFDDHSPQSLPELATPTDGQELQRSEDYYEILRGEFSQGAQEDLFLLRAARMVYTGHIVPNMRLFLPFRYFNRFTEVHQGVRGVMSVMGEFYPLLPAGDPHEGYVVVTKSYSPGFNQTIAFKHLIHVSAFTTYTIEELNVLIVTMEWVECLRLGSMIMITSCIFLD